MNATCVLLLALLVLVLWGTLFEARAGMESGVSRFFDSWIVLSAGILPLPALKTLAVLLFLNILFACLFRIPRQKSSAGLYLIHLSFLVLIAGSFAGERFRSFSEVVALAGPGALPANSAVVLDSSAALSFRAVSSDSSGAFVRVGNDNSGVPVRIAPNFPLKITPYSVYFEESVPMSPNLDVVRFQIRKDPFGFVPYLFSGLLLSGFILLYAGRIFQRKKMLICPV